MEGAVQNLIHCQSVSRRFVIVNNKRTAHMRVSHAVIVGGDLFEFLVLTGTSRGHKRNAAKCNQSATKLCSGNNSPL